MSARTDGVSLTEEQRHAVARRSEPLLLSAAAGSGKTSVLVERFVAAVRDDGIAPARILAITFTERAAGELRARVRDRLLELEEREAARDTEAAYVGTFHGFCARLLRVHPLAAGLDPDFAILDEGLAGRLRERAFALALRELLAGGRREAVDLLAAYGVDRVRAMIEQAHAELRSRGQRLPRLPPAQPRSRPDGDDADGDDCDGDDAGRAREIDADAARACALLDQLLHGFGRAYERLKRERESVDFDDLELLAGALLAERDGVRAAWSERFELLMVDEFQDTNPRQLAILGALDRGNLFTVGDELQSIYGFRHADVSLFRARRAKLEEIGASVRLTRNFRSRESLLGVVNAVFAGRFGDYAPLVAGRDEAPAPGTQLGLRTAPPAAAGSTEEPSVELLLTDVRGWEEREDLAGPIAAELPHTQLWRQAEARLLAQRVAELVHDGHTRAGEVVVLLRASGDLEVFERALQLQGLRTLAAVGTFWGHQQIGDLLSYLRALANPLDEQALYAALASPLAGCSRDCLALLAGAARTQRRGVWEIALAAAGGGPELALGLAPADDAALATFCALLQDERAQAARRELSELIERAIDASGYRERVLGLDWPERRLANVHKLLRLARRFEASEGRDLRGFLDHVEYLQQAVKVEPDAPVEGVEPDAVRLMTIHAAKGLEFSVVCVADLGRQPNTQTPDLLVDGQRVGLRLMRLDGARSKPALDYDELAGERRAGEAEEEDRILYVAMTRARERLLLSGAVDFARWPESRQAPTAISWLAPALSAELPALVRDGAAAVHDLTIGDGAGLTVRCRLNAPATVGDVLRLERIGRVASPPEQPVAGGQPLVHPVPSGQPSAQPVAGEQLSICVEGGASPALAPALAAATLSYTSLSELERCGYRYYLERVLALPEDRAAARAESLGHEAESPGHEGLEARARGTLVHRLMELYDFARPRPVSPADVARAAAELGMRVAEGERAAIARLIDTAATVELADRLARARSARREHPFAFPVGSSGPLITGVIDLLASEADGGALVVDYKSDRVGADSDLEAAVEGEYGVQRLLYALAVLRGGAASVEVVHWFLERPREWVSARYAAADRDGLERRLAERVARAGERGFAVSAQPHRGLCLTCPGRAGLCSWGERETLREEP
ncbi:MAG TPA: UvrD-helicase domain-containing protein [Solirubrobacteraceae bacterium]|jgi:ATP-dependent helicase/nuclease subunit A|nr:UvrD-helicase domain-containing protein [Solirubrobacteraceae bacterium]